MSRIIKIDVISDTICPWCYVGKRRLDTALKSFSNAKFEINWKPFFLDPNLPSEGVDKMEMYAKKFGKSRIEGMIAAMKQTGLNENPPIQFSYGGKVANTLDSHRLIEYSKHHNKQEEVVSELFSDYFEGEKNIGSRDVLTDAAVRAGLDGGQVSRFLESSEGVEQVKEEVEEAHLKYRVSGVPFFIFEGKYALSGAQEPEAIKRVVEKILTEQKPTTVAGDVCTIDGTCN
ncbi:hypothetical protein PROFUN_11808 [Planoprotostelium fungivorum]|uniref:DSBA-like thioredoxin domain-containing protein n=1 Tax=Planoprotostelium fungivorum TaxID=1890364 RepID=A0A2P6MRK4_9EUKA|nr:hypothetical protein PROFUN_11808 [Planoprotostelium fungivorum]